MQTGAGTYIRGLTVHFSAKRLVYALSIFLIGRNLIPVVLQFLELTADSQSPASSGEVLSSMISDLFSKRLVFRSKYDFFSRNNIHGVPFLQSRLYWEDGLYWEDVPSSRLLSCKWYP